MPKKTVTLMLLVAEIDADNEEDAQDVLDAFRERCSNNEIPGVTLYRAAGRDLGRFGLNTMPDRHLLDAEFVPAVKGRLR